MIYVGKFIDKNGDAFSRLISPGQGSSAWYPEDVLERDSVEAFSGAHIFMDHPTVAEAVARPERSVRDLVGAVVSTPEYLKEGPEGPGTYARWHVFKPFREWVEEMAPFIGMSIRVPGEKESVVVEGKKRVVAKRLIGTPFNSIDLVTRGARGGKLIAQESARPTSSPWAEEWLKESDSHSPKDIGAFASWMIERETREQHEKEREEMELREALEKIAAQEGVITGLRTEVARLSEAVAVRDARTLVEGLVNADTVDLPVVTKTRLVESLVKGAPMKEGVLDTEGLTTLVTEAIKTETEYVGTVLKETGIGSRVTGLGASEPGVGDPFREALVEVYLNEGLTTEQATAKADAVARGGR